MKNLPDKVNLVFAVFSQHQNLIEHTIKLLENKYGIVDFKSKIYPFDNTAYYEKEMGSPLFKQLISFEQLVSQENYHSIKIESIDLENRIKKENTGIIRPVNIDPGILEAGKFILFSTKNCMHRIYLNEGIYAEVTLLFYNGQWNHHRFTYPDFKLQDVKIFLNNVRKIYLNKLKLIKKP